MRETSTAALTITLLLFSSACNGGSKGNNGGAPTITPEFPCLSGKTWKLRAVSSSNIQQVGTWEFKTDGSYIWQRTKPLADGGPGKYTYAKGVLTVDGYLKLKLVSAGKIPLTFDRNRMSFTDDNNTTWTYDPPAACALFMAPDIRVETGEWRFDLLPDSGDSSEKLVCGELVQDQDLIRVDGEPSLQGVINVDRTWEVQVDAEFSFRGEFKETPANRFQGTYVRGGQSGQILGYRLE